MKTKPRFSILSLTTATLLAGLAPARADLHFSFENNDLSTEGWTVYQLPASTTSFGSMNHDGIYTPDQSNHLTPSDGAKFLAYTNWNYRDGFDDGNTPTEEIHYSSIVRSQTFVYNGTGDISMDLTGGRTIDNPLSPQMVNTDLPNALENQFPLNAGQLHAQRLSSQNAGWITHQGVALRDAVTGKYLGWIKKDVVNNRPLNYSEPAAPVDWLSYSFDEATMQSLTASNPNRTFQLDIYDSFGKGGWAWFGVDNIHVAGTAVTMLQGDTNDDGIVDNTDLGAGLGNLTSSRSSVPMGKDSVNNLATPGTDRHMARIDGDLDGDGDVTNTDLGTLFGNYGSTAPTVTAASSGLSIAAISASALAAEVPGQADLVYDPQTGHVVLDASDDPAGEFINFVVKNASNAFKNTASLTNPFLGTYFMNSASEVSATDPLGGALGNVTSYDMGILLDAGLTETQLQNLITQAIYVGVQGGGVKSFDIVVLAVPEPGSVFALLVSGAGLLIRRRRAT